MSKKNSIIGGLSKLATKKFFSQEHMLVDFEYLLFGKCFGLGIFSHVINIKMMPWQKIHGKIPIFELSGDFQSWQY